MHINNTLNIFIRYNKNYAFLDSYSQSEVSRKLQVNVPEIYFHYITSECSVKCQNIKVKIFGYFPSHSLQMELLNYRPQNVF